MHSNKELIAHAFAALATGDRKPFAAGMADDVCWIVTGNNSWSGVYTGKAAIGAQLLAPLYAQLAGDYTCSATRIVAEGDIVVVEAQGRAAMHNGERYDNRYCFVIRMDGGLMREITEYMDTELVAKTLAPLEVTAGQSRTG